MNERPTNPLHERYASSAMARLFSTEHRTRTWRRLWIVLAKTQRDLGLGISQEHLLAIEAAAPRTDLSRVAELERQTRHDVVAHLRHFAEQAGVAGGVLHLGATSAFITDNTDAIVAKEALELLERRLVTLLRALAAVASRTRAVAALAYTHFQPAQLTTVGKRVCLWAQDFGQDLEEVRRLLSDLRCRGAKGTTGTQASFLTLFDGDHQRVRELDRRIAAALGFAASWPITGQTYPRKQDSRVLHTLAGIGESIHKMGTDLRLLQGLGELAEPFGSDQVGSSAMAYKRNPIRAERMCGLARRILTDSLNGPLNAATQWLERSLDDSANRRLVLTDSFLTCDAILSLATSIASGITVNEEVIRTRVERELPFMATETILMEAAKRGGDRQELHERLRRYSLEAYEAVARGEENPLLERLLEDRDFRLDRETLDGIVDPEAFTGRSAHQVDEFLVEVLAPLLEGAPGEPVEEPRV